MRTLDKRINNTYFTSNKGTLGSYLNDISKYKVLSDKEIKEEIKKAKKGDEKAIANIVNSNQRFVFRVAKRFSNGNENLQADLINEANIGLINSIKNFDLKKDVTFLTYSVYWMQRQVFSYLTFINPMIKVSNKAKTAKVSEIRNRFFLLNGRNPTSEEIITELQIKYGIDISKEMDVYQMTTTSIDNPTITENYDDFSSYFLANAIDTPTSNVTSINDYEMDIENDYSKILISSSIGVLTDRERSVVELLFGINQFREYEIQEVAEKLGITNEAVRLINNRAQKKLKKEMGVKQFSI